MRARLPRVYVDACAMAPRPSTIIVPAAHASRLMTPAVSYTHLMFYAQRQMAQAEAYEYAAEVMARNMMEEDAAEGIDAFLQKRAPRWRA